MGIPKAIRSLAKIAAADGCAAKARIVSSPRQKHGLLRPKNPAKSGPLYLRRSARAFEKMHEAFTP